MLSIGSGNYRLASSAASQGDPWHEGEAVYSTGGCWLNHQHMPYGSRVLDASGVWGGSGWWVLKQLPHWHQVVCAPHYRTDTYHKVQWQAPTASPP